MDRKGLFQFIKFCVVGFFNTLISYSIYAGLTYLNVQYVVSNIVAFVLSVLHSFFWNNRCVFKKDEEEKRNMWTALLKTYISYSFTGLFLNNILLILLIEKMQFSKYLAPVVVLIVSVPINFFINKFWAFRKKNLSDS